MLTLYVGNSADYVSLAAHIALEEAGAVFETRKIDFDNAEQRGAAYLKINPKGRVPALATPKGVITETLAILTFIGQIFPKAKLVPSDPFIAAKLHELNGFLSSTVHPNFAHHYKGSNWTDDPSVIENLKVKVPQNIRENFALIESDYFKGPWVLGTEFTVADCYLFAVSRWLPDIGISIAEFPELNTWFAAMKARPSVLRAIASYA